MKFRTAHKDFSYIEDGHKRKKARAHRDGATVWTTGDVIIKHTFESVRKAKAWMQYPTPRI